MKGGIQRRLLDTLKWAGIKVITVKQTWGAMISVNEALVSTLADICDDHKNPTDDTVCISKHTSWQALEEPICNPLWRFKSFEKVVICKRRFGFSVLSLRTCKWKVMWTKDRGSKWLSNDSCSLSRSLYDHRKEEETWEIFVISWDTFVSSNVLQVRACFWFLLEGTGRNIDRYTYRPASVWTGLMPLGKFLNCGKPSLSPRRAWTVTQDTHLWQHIVDRGTAKGRCCEQPLSLFLNPTHPRMLSLNHELIQTSYFSHVTFDLVTM